MEAVTCGNFFVLGLWMVFISYSFGQLLNREELLHSELSNVEFQRFRSSNYAEVHLSRRPKVREHVLKKKEKRSVSSFDDPRWSKQTYLSGRGKFIADHNVASAWKKGYTGKNVTVAIVDNGLRYTHVEFQGRYRSELSYDFVDNDTDPSPASTSDGHGTKCAGVIAGAANNGECGVGVAYDAYIAGIRLISSSFPNDTQVAKAFYPFPGHDIDIFSNSWGPADSGFDVAGPGPLTQLALQDGASKGRGGLGSIYVSSVGNGVFFGDNCAFNGFVGNIYSIPVAAVDEDAKPSDSSESCSAIMTSAYSSNLETASVRSNTACDSNFGDTSAAAALVSGMIALALHARNTLTWRDVQHLIVKSSRSDIFDKSVQWTVNQAGFRVSNQVGFGFLDASLLIKNVEILNSTVSPQRKCEIVPRPEPSWGKFEKISFKIQVNKSQCGGVVINYLEHVVAIFDLEHFRRGVLGAYITSPKGTTSQVLFPRRLDSLTGNKRYKNVTTVSVHFWGEQASGTWNISLQNDLTLFGTGNGTLFGFSLILYGTGSAIPWTTPRPSTDIHSSSTKKIKTRTHNKPTTNSASIPKKDALVAVIVVASIIIICILTLVVIRIMRPLWLPSWCCHGANCHSTQPAAPNMTAGGEIVMENKVTV